MNNPTWQAAMNVVAAHVQTAIRAGREVEGLSAEAACLGALVGVLSAIRVEGLSEDQLLKTAQRAVPIRHQLEIIHSVVQ